MNSLVMFSTQQAANAACEAQRAEAALGAIEAHNQAAAQSQEEAERKPWWRVF